METHSAVEGSCKRDLSGTWVAYAPGVRLDPVLETDGGKIARRWKISGYGNHGLPPPQIFGCTHGKERANAHPEC